VDIREAQLTTVYVTLTLAKDGLPAVAAGGEEVIAVLLIPFIPKKPTIRIFEIGTPKTRSENFWQTQRVSECDPSSHNKAKASSAFLVTDERLH
jgi:hypothetical protein